ncbi:hypothetical protein DPEC_G00331720 [Dallia pectoralis]|uniref:Uncharacterized protein n=1 Tax=Dallia pectoralis TaxID=75939 RepID=A0ACC2F5W3_DALPE|nr:hypothetical protein DPEC_G00331720 [Dallia pectoralis]
MMLQGPSARIQTPWQLETGSLSVELAAPRKLTPLQSGLEKVLWEWLTADSTGGVIKIGGPPAEIVSAFKSGWDVADPYLWLGHLSSDHGADNTVVHKPILPEEVKSGLGSIKSGSAAGPDGLSKKALKTWDPTGVKLAEMYSVWFALGRMPKALKQCRTTLIPKSFKPDVCAHMYGWRLLTIGSVMTRLYSKVFNSRLTLHLLAWLFRKPPNFGNT